MEKPSKTWMYTLNNYTDEEIESIKDLSCSRHLCGKEVAPTTGTPHLQGRITFKTAKRLFGVKKLIKRANWRPALYANCDYEAKDGDIIIDINNKEQGRRTDLETVADDIKKNLSIREIAENNPVQYIRYNKGIMALRGALIKPRNEIPNVTVLWGSTGSGKSRMAREKVSSDGGHYVWMPQCGQWFDGYCGEKNVIFEEYRGQLPLGMLLMLTDRYDCKVQYKGGMIEFAATNIIFTSPKHPRNWYHQLDDEDTWKQLCRRLVTVTEVTV